MSYLSTVVEFIQNKCSEDPAIDELLKSIHALHRENIQIQKQLEESENEHVRLQIHLHNLDSTNSLYDKADIENSKQTNMKVFEASVDLRNLVAKIDFEKILKCTYLEMEAKCSKENEPIEKCIASTAIWHEKMKERCVVKEYRQAELALKEAEVAYKNQQESMEKSLKDILELIKNTTQRKNEIILNLVKGSKDMEKLREEMIQLKKYEVYIEGLNKQKIDLMKQLESSQYKAFNFNPINTYKTQDLSEETQNLETINIATPKYPSFREILNSFQMTETNTQMTVIENTTCGKSILHNSMELNQSITTKLTKKVHFKVPLEDYQEYLNTNSEIETEDTNSDSSQQTIINANEINEEDTKIVEETDIETIDLLTPSENKETKLSQEVQHIKAPNLKAISKEEPAKENLASFKPKIDIRECLVFKTPLPVFKDQKPICQEPINRPSTSNDSSFSPAPENIVKTSSNPCYDFCKTSLSSDMSDSAASLTKDFDTYFNENREFLFDSQSTETEEINGNFIKDRKKNLLPTDSNNKENEGFTFDDASDNNMGGNCGGSDLDFMFD